MPFFASIGYRWSFGLVGLGPELSAGLTETFGWAGAGIGVNATFTYDLAEEELSSGLLGEAEWAITGFTAPVGLAGAVSGISAGLILDPVADRVAGVPLAGCAERLVEDLDVGLAAGPIDGWVVFGLAGEVAVGVVNAGLTAANVGFD